MFSLWTLPYIALRAKNAHRRDIVFDVNERGAITFQNFLPSWPGRADSEAHASTLPIAAGWAGNLIAAGNHVWARRDTVRVDPEVARQLELLKHGSAAVDMVNCFANIVNGDDNFMTIDELISLSIPVFNAMKDPHSHPGYELAYSVTKEHIERLTCEHMRALHKEASDLEREAEELQEIASGIRGKYSYLAKGLKFLRDR